MKSTKTLKVRRHTVIGCSMLAAVLLHAGGSLAKEPPTARADQPAEKRIAEKKALDQSADKKPTKKKSSKKKAAQKKAQAAVRVTIVAPAVAVPAVPAIAPAPAEAAKGAEDKADAGQEKTDGDADEKPAEKGPDAEKPEAEEGAQAPAAAAVQFLAAPAMNMANMEQQLLAQYRGLLMAEVGFVGKVCKLSDDQRQKLQDAADKRLKKSVKKYAAAQQKMMQGVAVDAEISNEMNDPQGLARRVLESVAPSVLSAEQAGQLTDELSKRRAYRKRGAIQAFVAKLDDDLLLSAEQREQLVKRLDEKWQDMWGQYAENLLYNDQFMPQLPDELVVPVLNETQRKAWQEARSGQTVFFGGMAGAVMVAPVAAADVDVFEVEGEIGVEVKTAVEEAAVEEAAPGAEADKADLEQADSEETEGEAATEEPEDGEEPETRTGEAPQP